MKPSKEQNDSSHVSPLLCLHDPNPKQLPIKQEAEVNSKQSRGKQCYREGVAHAHGSGGILNGLNQRTDSRFIEDWASDRGWFLTHFFQSLYSLSSNPSNRKWRLWLIAKLNWRASAPWFSIGVPTDLNTPSPLLFCFHTMFLFYLIDFVWQCLSAILCDLVCMPFCLHVSKACWVAPLHVI